MAEPVISVRGLRKAYGGREAVRGIDLDVQAGEIFAFLGPNGAGKTTTVEILEGYRARDGGEVSVLGTDPASATRAWRQRIGIVLQTCDLQRSLTVRESLEQYAGYYPHPLPVADAMALVGLTGEADKRVAKLSGGLQRRLDVALALVGDPELVFLDEPTTGFDPNARRDAWEMIAGLRALEKTVFLTTHYLDEAETLADRVAVIKDGVIVAVGPPSDLGRRAASGTLVRFRLPATASPSSLPEPIATRVARAGDAFEFTTEQPVADLAVLCAWALEERVDLQGLEATRPTLEDAYLELTAGK